VAVKGWLLDTRAAAQAGEQKIHAQLQELAGSLYLCPVGALEQLCSARSSDYDALQSDLHASFEIVPVPVDLFDRGKYVAGWNRYGCACVERPRQMGTRFCALGSVRATVVVE
jgi:predicted nucleic acid-binding protein